MRCEPTSVEFGLWSEVNALYPLGQQNSLLDWTKKTFSNAHIDVEYYWNIATIKTKEQINWETDILEFTIKLTFVDFEWHLAVFLNALATLNDWGHWFISRLSRGTSIVITPLQYKVKSCQNKYVCRDHLTLQYCRRIIQKLQKNYSELMQ